MSDKKKTIEELTEEKIERAETVKEVMEELTENPLPGHAGEGFKESISNAESLIDNAATALEDTEDADSIEEKTQNTVEMKKELADLHKHTEARVGRIEEKARQKIIELKSIKQQLGIFVQEAMSNPRLQEPSDFSEAIEKCNRLIKEAEKTLEKTDSDNEEVWAKDMLEIRNILQKAKNILKDNAIIEIK